MCVNVNISAIWIFDFEQGTLLVFIFGKKGGHQFLFREKREGEADVDVIKTIFCYVFTTILPKNLNIKSKFALSCVLELSSHVFFLTFCLRIKSLAFFSFCISWCVTKKKSFLFLQRFTKYITSFSVLSQLFSYTQSHTHPFGCTQSLI